VDVKRAIITLLGGMLVMLAASIGYLLWALL
jgi:hypothetical protein